MSSQAAEQDQSIDQSHSNEHTTQYPRLDGKARSSHSQQQQHWEDDEPVDHTLGEGLGEKDKPNRKDNREKHHTDYSTGEGTLCLGRHAWQLDGHVHSWEGAHVAVVGGDAPASDAQEHSEQDEEKHKAADVPALPILDGTPLEGLSVAFEVGLPLI